MCNTIKPRTVKKNQICQWHKGNEPGALYMRVNVAKCKCGKLWAWIPGNEKGKVECEELK